MPARRVTGGAGRFGGVEIGTIPYIRQITAGRSVEFAGRHIGNVGRGGRGGRLRAGRFRMARQVFRCKVAARFGFTLGKAVVTQFFLQLVDVLLHVLLAFPIALVPAVDISALFPGGIAAIICRGSLIVFSLDIARGMAGVEAALIDGAIRFGGGEDDDEHDGQDQGQGCDNVLHNAATLCSGGWIIRHKQHSFQRLPRRFAPRNDKLGGCARFNGGRCGARVRSREGHARPLQGADVADICSIP
nr:MAG TPA: hypothetical protein [Caudoviricetes sp.]